MIDIPPRSAAEDRLGHDSGHYFTLTPPGRGAVASVALYGPLAREVVSRWFRPAAGGGLSRFPAASLVFGQWLTGRGEASEPTAEQVVLCPHSDHYIEIHCHGGLAAAEAIQAALSQSGCRRADPQEWAAAREPGPIAAAARVALASAPTLRAAAVLLDQYRGALRQALTQVVGLLAEGRADRAMRALAAVAQQAPVGLHLTTPWRVVLAGPANVGKSSLLNALLGYRRAVVHAAPGATRDVLTAPASFDGWPLQLSDTAGLRPGGDAVESEGVARARAELASADLVVLVFDASQPWSTQDQQLRDSLPQALAVHNKCDLPICDARRRRGCLISALTGAGLSELIAAIASGLAPAPPAPGAAVPFTREQTAAIDKAMAALEQGDHQAAAQTLNELIGR